MKIFVERAGFLTSVQDLGREGFRRFGVSLGGALDRSALRTANLLVGNDTGAAGLEITLGGLRARFTDERWIAWGGGTFEASIPPGRAVRVNAGDEVTFGQASNGCRCWLAISGGVDVPVILDSRSTDLRARFGGFEGRALCDEDELSLGETKRIPTGVTDSVAPWSAPLPWTQTASEHPTLRMVRGSDWERFDSSSRFAFTSVHFDVTPDSNRMGARLSGARLQRVDDVELVSAAVAPGTIQVPPSGQPIVLLGDCQTVGGYPRIGHVITVDLPLAAQLRPGDTVRFREVSLAEAHHLLRQREHDFGCFRIGLRLRMS